MKFIIIVTLLNGGTFEWETFNSEVEAECYKTLLFDWNRKNGYTLKRRGFDVPKTWAEYNKKVFITTK
jgi:hypothetical protein